MADLMNANGISDANIISAGQELVIPGLTGVSGVLDTEAVALGETFAALSRRSQLAPDTFRTINRLISPSELYVGSEAVLARPTQDSKPLSGFWLPEQGSGLESAISLGISPWLLAAQNRTEGTWDLLHDATYFSDSEGASSAGRSAFAGFESVDLASLPITQGDTVRVVVKPANSAALSGDLAGHALHFFSAGDGRLVALQGVHAMIKPGLYPLTITATRTDGTIDSIDQLVVIGAGAFAKESLPVPPETIDPAVTGPEDKQVAALVAPATETKQWSAVFGLPVAEPFCVRDRYGTRRSFNGSAYDYFHSGTDYGVCSTAHPFDIYAAAPGIVVFAGQLTVRGNATIIDHGWGVYSGYYHQDSIGVAVGQQVDAGQLIGQIGATGRVTGPHLHFEVWVGGVAVNPGDWLNTAYP